MTDNSAALPADIAEPVSEPAKTKEKLKLSSLRMIASFTARYPRQIGFALLALITAAGSTLAIPAGLKLIIDEGFACFVWLRVFSRKTVPPK